MEAINNIVHAVTNLTEVVSSVLPSAVLDVLGLILAVTVVIVIWRSFGV